MSLYLGISQNPIIGINQSRNQFWSKVSVDYHLEKTFVTQPKPNTMLNANYPECNRQIEGMCTISQKFESKLCFKVRHSEHLFTLFIYIIYI